MTDFLNKRSIRTHSLNAEQKKAVLETEGALIILAGAGSGKTRVLVYKVLYLIIEKQILPTSILMVTFTNKAAGEMKERIIDELTRHGCNMSTSSLPIVGTFHSLCARILRRDGEHIGLSHRFKIYDEHDQQETIKDALNQLAIPIKNIKPRSVLHAISSAKNQMIDPASYITFARGFFQETVAKVYPLYQKLLRERDAVDFDDLLLETVRLFKSAPQILEKYQNTFQYVLVDEYQDTNAAQYTLTQMLGGKRQNICIVGDFSQSIYSFRGADFRNLERFKADFPDTKTLSLSQNYRSTQRILDAAYAIISKNTTHPILSLWTGNAAGEDVVLYQAETEQQEVEYIIGKILEERTINPQFSFSDAAVLYRTNAQSRAVEEVLLHHGIPYTLIGGVRFYERREIKDVLALLSYLANQKDIVSLKRVEKIGKRRLAAFLKYVSEFNENNFIEKKSTIELLDEVIKKISYLDLFSKEDPEDSARLENIKELRSVAIEFPDIIQFLENVSLVEQDRLPDSVKSQIKPNAVTLMTLHAAKGLEFKMVFMIGMEEGLFPHSQSLLDSIEIEEERRLCYVGITRAKEKLFLTFSRRRLIYGQRLSPTVSRFIFELPEEVLKENLSELYNDEPDFM